jgi:hypothetical protein
MLSKLASQNYQMVERPEVMAIEWSENPQEVRIMQAPARGVANRGNETRSSTVVRKLEPGWASAVTVNIAKD